MKTSVRSAPAQPVARLSTRFPPEAGQHRPGLLLAAGRGAPQLVHDDAIVYLHSQRGRTTTPAQKRLQLHQIRLDMTCTPTARSAKDNFPSREPVPTARTARFLCRTCGGQLRARPASSSSRGRFRRRAPRRVRAASTRARQGRRQGLLRWLRRDGRSCAASATLAWPPSPADLTIIANAPRHRPRLIEGDRAPRRPTYGFQDREETARARGRGSS